MSQNKDSVGQSFWTFRGAFDSITPVSIFSALEDLGLGGRLYVCIKGYLGDRYIFMITEDGNTKHYVIFKGVPQGEVLSPTLCLQ